VTIVCSLIQLYVLLLVVRVVMSWFPISRNGPAETVAGFLYLVTDPVLVPLRRILPPVRMGAMALDLSPIVAFFGLSVLRGILCS
jgi:YggT family protein